MLRPLTLQDLVDESIAEAAADEPRREYVGASMIGTECTREIWYNFRWYGRPDFPPRIRRRFTTGDKYEERVIDRLSALDGWTVHHENPHARNPKAQYAAEYGPLGGLLRGHTDGFVAAPAEALDRIGVPAEFAGKPALLEVKALASAKYTYADDAYNVPDGNKSEGRTEGRWFELQRKGVEAAQQRHYAQCQTYMGLSRAPDRNGKLNHVKWGIAQPLDWCLYVGVNTDTEQWYAEAIPFRPKWYDRAIERAIQVVRAEDPPPRISENPASWSCTFCDFHRLCHGDAEPDRNCRSCARAEIKVPGDAGFHGNIAQWLCTEHGHACGDYTACDQWTKITDEGAMF